MMIRLGSVPEWVHLLDSGGPTQLHMCNCGDPQFIEW